MAVFCSAYKCIVAVYNRKKNHEDKALTKMLKECYNEDLDNNWE